MIRVYLDNAATTLIDPEVFKVMKPYLTDKYGNPSEPHLLGQEAKKALENTRESVANFFGAQSEEIIFTSCATESINLAHKGFIESVSGKFPKGKLPHIITSSIEHKAVLETCAHLEKFGRAEVTYLPVDKYGVVGFNSLKEVIKKETVLVSVMYVNNEVGTIQPIKEIGSLIKKLNKSRRTKIYFHTDATQAVNYLNCDVNYLGVDLLSFTGHKIYAPKGIGALFVRGGTSLIRQMDGGGQEQELRAGTENVAYIVALGRALKLIGDKKELVKKKTEKLRNILIKGILETSGVKLIGHPSKRIAHIASFLVDNVEGEAAVLLFSSKGIYVSSGSACTSSELKPSHVLTAMGVDPAKSHGSLRFSLGKDTLKEDIKYVLNQFPKVIKKLRKMSPLN